MQSKRKSIFARLLRGNSYRARLGVYRASIGGIVIFLLGIAGGLTANRISGSEALALLETMMPTVRFFISSTMTAAATVLALMLTLLSLSFSSRSRLKPTHYRRIQNIAFVTCITFIAATFFMIVLLVSVPLEETNVVPQRWFDVFYFIVIGMTAALGGLLVGVVLLLFSALRDMINVLALGQPIDILVEQEDSEESEQ